MAASRARTLLFFLVWYALDVVYTDANKSVLAVLHLPWTLAALQLGLGLLYVTPMWALGLRPAPRLTPADALAALPLALVHTAGQCAALLSLGAGSLAAVHVVKATEPLLTAAFGALLAKDALPWHLNACLVPVVVGAGLASGAGTSLAWPCAAYAAGATVALSLRAVLAKRAGSGAPSATAHNMDAGNSFAVMSALAFLAALPCALALEGPRLSTAWQDALRAGVYSQNELLGRLAGSALAFYLANETAMYALDAVHPTAHAVGHTAQRVVLLLLSALRLGTPMSGQGATGCAVAVGGVLAFSSSMASAEFKHKRA